MERCVTEVQEPIQSRKGPPSPFAAEEGYRNTPPHQPHASLLPLSHCPLPPPLLIAQSSTFKMLQDEQYDFLKNMPAKARESLRKQVIEMVLATDMKQHFSQASLFK